ncbi:MAG: DUF58 domain-containing protein [Phycisphaeraceae bacterium]|nr:DUF58 domain-containing protein [Phycisphaeraceae bacterium]
MTAAPTPTRPPTSLMRSIIQKLRRALTDTGQTQVITEVMQGGDPNRYLDPSILSKVGISPLLAKLVVEGFINGLHKSPFHGFSVEFADHREYVPGDDLKYIDWHLFARTDHYYIKRYEEETNLRCYILLDRSASMAFGTGKITKWDYSCFLATCLAYLIIKQQDAAGLALFGAKPGIMVPARAKTVHLRQMMQVMINNPPSGDTDVASSLRAITRNLKRRGLVVVISDLIDDPETTLRSIRLLASHKHDVIVFHVQDAAELEFTFDGATLFKDMETGEELEIDPSAVRATYLQRMNEVCDFYRKGLTEVGIDYQLINTRMPYDHALSAYLKRRARTRK